MGGGSYDRDVHGSSSYSSWGASSYSEDKLSATNLDKSLEPKGKVLKSTTKNPLIIVLDVTGSNIDFARIVYDKLPMFYGEIENKKYLEDFDISICAVGDAYTDDYPLQIGDFAKGIEIDSWIEKIVLEAGGGGQNTESYELAAHYLLNNTEFNKDANPIVIFIGDEKPYEKVEKDQARDIGIPIEAEYNPFPELNKKFNGNVFMMLNKYCGRTENKEITDSWKQKLEPEHVIKIKKEKSIVDLMLGVVAILGKQSIKNYTNHMLQRGQTNERIAEVSQSLKEFSDSAALMEMPEYNVDSPKVNVLKMQSSPGKRIQTDNED